MGPIAAVSADDIGDDEENFGRMTRDFSMGRPDRDDAAIVDDADEFAAGNRRRPYANHTTIGNRDRAIMEIINLLMIPDWVYDLAKDRMRLKLLRSAQSGWRGHLRTLWDSSQAWLLASAVGRKKNN